MITLNNNIILDGYAHKHKVGEQSLKVKLPTIECPNDTYSYSNLLDTVTGSLSNVDWWYNLTGISVAGSRGNSDVFDVVTIEIRTWTPFTDWNGNTEPIECKTNPDIEKALINTSFMVSVSNLYY